jgi:hypothetical protein
MKVFERLLSSRSVIGFGFTFKVWRMPLRLILKQRLEMNYVNICGTHCRGA